MWLSQKIGNLKKQMMVIIIILPTYEATLQQIIIVFGPFSAQHGPETQKSFTSSTTEFTEVTINQLTLQLLHLLPPLPPGQG
jgi:hypothetical protein